MSNAVTFHLVAIEWEQTLCAFAYCLQFFRHLFQFKEATFCNVLGACLTPHFFEVVKWTLLKL